MSNDWDKTKFEVNVTGVSGEMIRMMRDDLCLDMSNVRQKREFDHFSVNGEFETNLVCLDDLLDFSEICASNEVEMIIENRVVVIKDNG